MTDVTVSRRTTADPHTVYRLVSDVTRMGDWSPETTSCRWLDGATGPAVGARFRGNNSYRYARWSTTCTVTAADEGSRFSFDVSAGPLPVSTWTYELVPEPGGGCVVNESWTERRALPFRVAGNLALGHRDRGAHNRAGMERTLESLTVAAEAAAGQATTA